MKRERERAQTHKGRRNNATCTHAKSPIHTQRQKKHKHTYARKSPHRHTCDMTQRGDKKKKEPRMGVEDLFGGSHDGGEWDCQTRGGRVGRLGKRSRESEKEAERSTEIEKGKNERT